MSALRALRPLVGLLALAAAIAAHATPLGWFGLRTPAPAPAAVTWNVIVSGPVAEAPGATGVVNLAMSSRVLITGALRHHGTTACQPGARCLITPPQYSPRWTVWPDGRLTLSAAATLPSGGVIDIYAGHPDLPGAGAGRIEVQGVLTLAGPATLSVWGVPRYLPLPLLSAYGIPAVPAAGTLPVGTALELRPGPGLDILYLVEAL